MRVCGRFTICEISEEGLMWNTPLKTNTIKLGVKPVFHFKRTVSKRIKNVFKFQNFVNVDWLILP
jgi:hypothetical protein